MGTPSPSADAPADQEHDRREQNEGERAQHEAVDRVHRVAADQFRLALQLCTTVMLV